MKTSRKFTPHTIQKNYQYLSRLWWVQLVVSLVIGILVFKEPLLAWMG